MAKKIIELFPQASILFVGAKGRMEMTKVPEAGFEIVGLWISGLQRKLALENLLLPLKVISSLIVSAKIIKKVKPDVVIGFGGYASGPILYQALKKNIPAVIQEQNSHAGITNKYLGKMAQKIFVAYDGMDKYFPKEKIINSGNPVREDILQVSVKKPQALEFFNITDQNKTLLVLGGSLGARTINESVVRNIQKIVDAEIQMIWQTGKLYFDEMNKRCSGINLDKIQIHKFIDKMDLAYAVADVVISRAGALTVAELTLAAKPVIFVPSPNVAEDHQTKNATYLAEREAAIMIKDHDAREKLVKEALNLMKNVDRQTTLKENIAREGKPGATEDIVKNIITLIN